MKVTAKSNLPEHLCYPEGFIGKAVEHMTRTAEYICEEFFLAAAISAVGTLAGRKVVDYRGTNPNTYLVCLGLTGCGKEHGRRFLQDLLGETGLVVSDKFTSETAMANQLELTPSCVSLTDEFGKYTEAICKKNATGPIVEVGGAMMSLYTSKVWQPKAFVDKSKAIRINRPCLSIYGTSTPSTFYGSMSGGELASGFTNRIVIMLSPGGGYTRRMRFKTEPIPSELIEFVEKWVNTGYGPGDLAFFNPTPRELGISQDASTRIENHFDQIAERRIGEALVSASYWSRCSEKTSRFALISAIGRGSDSIEIEDANWGIAVSNFLTRRAIALAEGNIADSPHELNVQKVLNIIGEKGVLSQSDLGQKLRWLKIRERNEVLAQLFESGELIQVVRKTKGRQANGVATSVSAIRGTSWIAVTAELFENARTGTQELSV